VTESLKRFLNQKTRIRTSTVSIRFYPYRRLKNTIRLDLKGIRIRISDILQDAPLEVLSSLAIILVSKVARIKPSREYVDLYNTFITQPMIQDRIERVRRQRGSKRLLPSKGKNFDLAALFDELNLQYFNNQVEILQLGWSTTKAKKTLGHFDPAHQSITINQRLDNPLVPEYAVKFVLYHEMLHSFLTPEKTPVRRKIHHREFREQERRFQDYKRAKRFISKNF
jgi:hypothetical protein